MQTILYILRLAGYYKPDLHLRIENPPYLPLVIEAVPEPGPLGLPAISVTHYGEQNGDLMRDPEVCFELVETSSGPELDPCYWRNDYLGVEQFSRTIVRGHYAALSSLHAQHQKFAAIWDKNLDLQGFLAAFNSGYSPH